MNQDSGLRDKSVRHIVSDMKTLTMRDLNRKTATVLDALERGETFELRRNSRVVGYLTHTPPEPERKPDWRAHFDWLAKQKDKGGGFVEELEQDRNCQRAREAALEAST
jgi:antitoxin (DNA-binding transcriptional repressor) of toxin-antitoxin stability system